MQLILYLYIQHQQFVSLSCRLDFVITSDNESEDNRKYTVEYSERLSHWPYLINRNKGDVEATTRGCSTYLIKSKHSTSFFWDLFSCKFLWRGIDLNCILIFTFPFSVTSLGHFEITTSTQEGMTLLKEQVQYQCPPVPGLIFFCRREVAFQRKHIFDNMKWHFKNQKI